MPPALGAPGPSLSKSTYRLSWRAALSVAVAVLLATAVWVHSALGAPAPGSHRTKLFTVRSGDTAAQIGTALAREGLVSNAWLFSWWSRVSHLDAHLRAGVYVLSPSMSLPRVMAILSGGDILQYRVTIPSGSTVQEMVSRLVAQHIASRRALEVALAKGLPGLSTPSGAAGVKDPVEGFLFPDTYSFPAGTPARQVVLAMWANFQARTDRLLPALAARHLTLWGWVTLASIVQAESGYAPDEPKIAAVFDNRLRIGMKLQSDATVRYALGHPVVGTLTDHDLAVASPYNTYRVAGLPPGPIDAPGLTALMAVLHPAAVPYLYFVGMPNGHSLFATTYAQHEAQVARVAAMAAKP